MALIKTEEEREVATLQALQKQIEKRSRRERVHHLLIGGLSVLSAVAFFAGHSVGHHCAKSKTKKHTFGL